MNKIERELMKRAQALLFEYATEEIERIKKELEQRNSKTLLNVFDTGLIVDLDKVKIHGINRILKAIGKAKKR